MLVDFAKKDGKAVLNIYFKRRIEHRTTWMSLRDTHKLIVCYAEGIA